MTAKDAPIVIYTTFPSAAEARQMATALVEARLAACANISAPMTALYEWQGKLEEAEEVAMLIKTRAAHQASVIAEIERRHSYDTPAILVWSVEGGAAGYLDWILAQTSLS